MSQNRRRKRGRKPASDQNRTKGQKSRNEPKLDPTEFWGSHDDLPDSISEISEVPDAKSVVRSLGRVPISGHETAADHWFSLVYDRAAVLAGALAAAGGLQGSDDS